MSNVDLGFAAGPTMEIPMFSKTNQIAMFASCLAVSLPIHLVGGSMETMHLCNAALHILNCGGNHDIFFVLHGKQKSMVSRHTLAEAWNV